MFNRKEYARSYYLKTREKQLERDRLKYVLNRDRILARRKELLASESPEKRAKRLSFHKKYNIGYAQKMRNAGQTDVYKYKSYAGAAKRRGYSFELSDKEFSDLFHSQCSYCGKPESRGIDRVDNLVGYTTENSVSCCGMCNKMKWRFSREEFIEHAKAIAHYQK